MSCKAMKVESKNKTMELELIMIRKEGFMLKLLAKLSNNITADESALPKIFNKLH